METPRPTRWRRRDARRRSSVRRLLLAGAATGLVAGIVAQSVVDGTVQGSEIEWLVRVALVLPVLVFLLWWLVVPGISLEEPDAATAVPIPAEKRLERIEATFDSAAVPRARRSRLDHDVDDVERATYRASIRRDVATSAAGPASFGIRRPAPRAEASDVSDAAS